MAKKRKVLFVSLGTFTQTGGIEKFNRCFLKALHELQDEADMQVQAFSLYDENENSKYFPAQAYRYFSRRKTAFISAVLKEALSADIVYIAHVNLAFLGILVRLVRPAARIVVITHGIDIWTPLDAVKRKLLQRCHKILTVSHYNIDKLVHLQKVDASKIEVFYNTVDPFLALPENFNKPVQLLQRYQLNADNPLIVSVARLKVTEKFKGYDTLLEILPSLSAIHPGIKYMLIGKAEAAELQRINELTVKHGIQDRVILTGFVPDEEIMDHYLLADCFAMPSKKEGFGIVFIEAMMCGLPVVAGNKDGSVDALQNGRFGQLIDPDDKNAIRRALVHALEYSGKDSHKTGRALQQEVFNQFGFPAFKQRLLTSIREMK
ncbi:glycosyltransferase family 4 protein [Deminuibacter soli]|uniref:Glycosyltransferase family 1 protein n=1 Tax=Deminuibacter soli TaxID=2291815 RepID=A0A3E1NHQ9_9BACT|nr:glycosyltransferase family 4 protein [Deminuibacter soli]RFM27401.1 glycosyltransferase family 1 protein [Deminuibacter soli]